MMSHQSWNGHLQQQPFVFSASPMPPWFLFHYTNESGMTSIMSQQWIKGSCPAYTNSYAHYGDGVYLTSIPPNAPDSVILSNNWNQNGITGWSEKRWSPAKIAKLQYCFAIPTDSLSPWTLCKIWDSYGRDIWVYRVGISIHDKDFSLIKRW